MEDLISRLENAHEGSRELDCYIWAVVHGKGQDVRRVGPPTYDPERFFCNPHPDIAWIGYDLLNNALPYTTSIDAALTLVPNDAGIEFNRYWVQQDDKPRWTAIVRWGLSNAADAEDVPTPALALCIAALKARHG